MNSPEKIVLFVLSKDEFRNTQEVVKYFFDKKEAGQFEFNFNIKSNTEKRRNINEDDLVLFLYYDEEFGGRKIYANGLVSKSVTENKDNSDYYFHFEIDIQTLDIYEEGLILDDLLSDQNLLKQAKEDMTPPYVKDQDKIKDIQNNLNSLSFKELIKKINKDLSNLGSKLQRYRKEYKNKTKTANNTMFCQPKPINEYAYHDGGRKEIQFNIAIDKHNSKNYLRYGLAFSLETGQDLPNPIEILDPFIKAFNSISKEIYSDYKFYKYKKDGTKIQVNNFYTYETGDFLFWGKYCEWNERYSKYEEILDTFWELFPLYKKVMEGAKKMEILEKEFNPILLNNKQLIIHGAPGTGKTHTAKEIAKNLTNNNDFQYKLVQFHPFYDYTDFVDGLKPFKTSDDDTIQFKLVNGSFKEFCRIAGVVERIKAAGEEVNKDNIEKFLAGKQKAIDFWTNWLKNLQESNQEDLPPFIFIIDEINRAEVSRVFGELFYAIEPDYRGKEGKAKTQYSFMNNEETFFVDKDDDYFFVPSNVYIIGTMNDIDRSVEIFDFAIRRRFAWYEIKANETMGPILDSLDIEPDTIEKAKSCLERINEIIVNIPGLNESYHIGAAYFRKIKEYNNYDDKWDKFWKYHLEPLLKEYLRGHPEYSEQLEELEKGFKGEANVTT